MFCKIFCLRLTTIGAVYGTTSVCHTPTKNFSFFDKKGTKLVG